MLHKFPKFFKKKTDTCSICGITRYRNSLEYHTCSSYLIEMDGIRKYKDTNVTELTLISLEIAGIGVRNFAIPIADFFYYIEEENLLFGIYADLSEFYPGEVFTGTVHIVYTDDPTTHRAYDFCSLGHQRLRFTFRDCVGKTKDKATVFSGSVSSLEIDEVATEWNEKL